MSRPGVLRRAVHVGLASLLVLVLTAGAFAALIASRMTPVAMPALERNVAGQHTSDIVYLFVGADTGIQRAANDVQNRTPSDQARADAIVLVRLGADGTASAVSIPRDVMSTDGTFEPLALSLLDGPTSLIASVCSTTGVAVDRYVSIDGSGFVDAIDALGGVEVELDAPVRDQAAELSIGEAGRQRISGATALALVRSRHAEELIGGKWRSVSEADGARQRTQWSGRLLGGVRYALSNASPATLWHTVWTSSANLSVGGGMHPDEWHRLARADLDITELPARQAGDGRALTLDATSNAALVEAGFSTGCALP